MPRVQSQPSFAPRLLPFSLAASLFVLLLAWATPASAEERTPAGRVLVTTGSVEAVAADGTTRKLRRRARFFEGETIRTGERGRTQVRFTDGALLSIRQNTQIKVDQYRFENRDESDRKALTLTTGSIRTVTGRIGQVNRAAYRVSTPLAVIGIRGTDWEALQQPNGPLLLGVNDGGITAQSTNGTAAELGAGANFNYAQVSPEGNLQLLAEPPAALVEAGAVDEQVAEEGGAEGASESTAEGEGEEGGADGDSEADSEADGESGEVGADAPPTPPPPSGGGESSGGADSGGGGRGGNEPAPPPPPVVNVNPSEEGMGVPATTDPLIRVFTTAEEELIIGGSQLALVAGMRLNPTANSQALLGLGGPDDDDATPSFNFAFPTLSTIPTDRRAALTSANRLVQREGVALSGRTENVGGIAGLTFGRYDASTTTPLKVFTDPALSTQFFELTSPYVFAIFNPASIANLTGRLQYTPANSLISVSTGSVSTLLSDIVLNVNLGSGTIERGVLDIGFGSTPDAFVFLTDFEGTIGNGLFNAVVTDIVLQDNGTSQTLAARGSIRGSFTGSSTIPSLVLSFDLADTAGRNQFARGVVQYTGANAPPPPSLALSTTEQAQTSTGFFFLAGQSAFTAGVTAGRASNAADTLGRPVFVAAESTTDPGDFADITDPGNVFGQTPRFVARQAGASTANFATVSAPGFENTSFGRWLGTTVAPVEIRNASTGVLDQAVGSTVLWTTFQPRAINTVAVSPIHRVFNSATGPGFFGEFGTSTGQRVPVLGVRSWLSAIFDPASAPAGAVGVVTGRMFLTTEQSGPDEFGFDVEVEGTIVSRAGGTFIEFTAPRGAYRGRIPVDLSFDALGGVTGTGAPVGLVVQLHAESDPLVGQPDLVAAISFLAETPETRVDAYPAGTQGGRVGIALFQPSLDGQTGQPIGPFNLSGGALVGKSTAVDLGNPGNFFIMANNVDRLDAPRFYDAPPDFIVRAGGATISDVAAVGSDSSGPFSVGWGRWQVNSDTGNGASVQDNPANATSQVVFSREVLFASVRPTDVGNVTGVADYRGTLDPQNGGNAQLLAFGGPIGSPATAFDVASVSVNVDFNSGLVNGALVVGSSQLDTDFIGQFNGRLYRNVADLTFTTLDVRVSGNTLAGDLVNSSGVGIVTGPTGDQFITGFQLIGNGQHVEGFVTSDRFVP